MTQAVYGQDNPYGANDADSIRCFENYNIAGSLFNSKQYAQAYESWDIVYTTCPGYHKNLYIMGPNIIKYKLKEVEEAGDEAAKNALVDQLLAQYDTRMKYFPGKEAYVTAAKAYVLYQYRLDSSMNEIYQMYEKAISIDPKEMSATQIQSYFFVAVKLFNEDALELSEVFDIYNQIDEAVAANTDDLNVELAELRTKRDSGMLDARGARILQSDSLSLRNFIAVKSNIDIKLRPILSSCDKIALVYNAESYAENKDNETWIRRAVRTLGAEYTNDSGEVASCRDNPLFFEMTERLYQMNPSTEAARNMGRLALARKDYSKALQYFGEAMNQELDPVLKADDLLKYAYCQQQLGRLADAKSSIMQSIALNKTGQAYLQLSVIYASAAGVCGSDAVEKNAVYWAAIDKANIAVSLDPSLRSAANRAIASYKKGVPTKRVAFDLGKTEGTKYTIGCWINETVTFEFYN
ncbi:MAG: hypothetical protein EP346_08970 [Bacteroidetes bacterium]|uniref:Uncharacterized protein n=1 Tax=Phaeocystidibacter marisrubri TaxID=1577780 RepID=A0A6L3ZD86_9FLAO|nr:hypothetical protein [Phaeocystidibacter marisrubri]KAB2815813.1 hypothetical protein F8C82_08930 [Phaeocystidibacter marisrubri]TNE28547.1 MAG: hypothetical protein EP346_08970 [Bacteroidota bacterium]GGH65833.1 hypothetical protein GCM10011318_03220 [Phaeocystidibacter marisrubri]